VAEAYSKMSTIARIENFIGGAYANGPGRKAFEDVNPATGLVYATVDEARESDVDAAVNAARKALKGPWGKLTVDQRAKLMHKIADSIEAHFSEFLAAEIADTGKPTHLASHLDIPRGAANFRIFADILKHHPTETFQMATPDGGEAMNYTMRSPKGVIAVICPWNLPLLLMTWKVAPALACGNTVVVKPSEETPATAALLGRIMKEAGVPDGVYNVVHGFGPGSAGEMLTRHPGVNAITFTGETRTGTAIMQTAAVGVRPVSFEMGGKNAGLIFADCDLEKALEQTARAVFLNSGQVCLQTERLYVERSIYDRFVEGLAAKAQALKPGDPLDHHTTFGPVISLEHRKKILSYYDKAKAGGAEIITGGSTINMPGNLAGGAWVQPTIWTGLPETSAVIQEEIFGPCVHIRPFDNEDEAITLANETVYGLASMVWTNHLGRAHRVAKQLESGIVWVNSWFLRDLRTAFGGSKQSGIGREGGIHSLEFYTELKNICVRL
jgi:aminomuconate-semialdehyde/2-hydroxymuconate-6-semialdehyde dehydrogenase